MKKPLKILAINPGTRYLGIAVFQGAELRDWGVKALKGKWSKEKIKKAMRIIFSFIEQYEPNVLAIKKLHPSWSSSNLNKLAAEIKELSKRKGLRIYQYSVNDLEAFFSPAERINRKKLAEIIALDYPELFHELEKEKSHKNPYYIRMFEAVALGSICFHQLDKPCQRITQKS
jgi:hypothetical protein